MGVNESDVGLLATGLYIGNVIGSLICPWLFSKFQSKYIIIGATILNGLSVCIFALTTQYWVIFGSRCLAGLF